MTLGEVLRLLDAGIFEGKLLWLSGSCLNYSRLKTSVTLCEPLGLWELGLLLGWLVLGWVVVGRGQIRRWRRFRLSSRVTADSPMHNLPASTQHLTSHHSGHPLHHHPPHHPKQLPAEGPELKAYFSWNESCKFEGKSKDHYVAVKPTSTPRFNCVFHFAKRLERHLSAGNTSICIRPTEYTGTQFLGECSFL